MCCESFYTKARWNIDLVVTPWLLILLYSRGWSKTILLITFQQKLDDCKMYEIIVAVLDHLRLLFGLLAVIGNGMVIVSIIRYLILFFFFFLLKFFLNFGFFFFSKNNFFFFFFFFSFCCCKFFWILVDVITHKIHFCGMNYFFLYLFINIP